MTERRLERAVAERWLAIAEQVSDELAERREFTLEFLVERRKLPPDALVLPEAAGEDQHADLAPAGKAYEPKTVPVYRFETRAEKLTVDQLNQAADGDSRWEQAANRLVDRAVEIEHRVVLLGLSGTDGLLSHASGNQKAVSGLPEAPAKFDPARPTVIAGRDPLEELRDRHERQARPWLRTSIKGAYVLRVPGKRPVIMRVAQDWALERLDDDGSELEVALVSRWTPSWNLPSDFELDRVDLQS